MVLKPLLLVLALVAPLYSISKSDKEAQIKAEWDEELRKDAASTAKMAREEKPIHNPNKKRYGHEMQYRPRVLTKEMILEDHAEMAEGERRFPDVPALAYITPWNNKGYDRAVAIANKLTHVSPVWLQLKPSRDSLSCKIEGQHDIDHGWMARLWEKNEELKIMPRLLFEGWSQRDLAEFFQNERWSENCILDVNDMLERNRFNGVVLEVWLSAMAASQAAFNNDGADAMMIKRAKMFLEVIRAWGVNLHDRGMQLILPIPPPVLSNGETLQLYFNKQYWSIMSDGVDYIQVMTHDYKPLDVKSRFPMAPLEWVEKNIAACIGEGGEYANRVLVGLNHYGLKTDYGHGKQAPIMGDEYIEQLKDPKSELIWDESASEHYVTMGKVETYFPSLSSIEIRMLLVKDYGAGISIWDLGQGLNYFSRVL